MKIITISREFGSGGRELGRHIADLLGFDYYDSEIITAIAKDSGMDIDYVEDKLSNHEWRSYPVTFGRTMRLAAYVQSESVKLLLKQKEVIEKIAGLGKDFVIIGRNADVILEDYNTFNIFVCATTESKIKRCMERKPEDETFSEKELLHKMRHIDKIRSQTRAIMSGSKWGEKEAYHLIVNTSDWNIKELAAAVSDFANRRFGRT